MTHSPDPRARAQAAYEAWNKNRVEVADFMLAFAESERKIAAEAAMTDSDLIRSLRTEAADMIDWNGRVMGAWDTWRAEIAAGDAGSAPRDGFESYLGHYAELMTEAADSLAAKDAEIVELREEVLERQKINDEYSRDLIERQAELATLRARVEGLEKAAGPFAELYIGVSMLPTSAAAYTVLWDNEKGARNSITAGEIHALCAALAKGKTGEEG